jgi:undecaprenyl-diphosphatase
MQLCLEDITHFHKFFFGLLATFLIALITQWLMKMMFSYGRPFTAGLHSLYEYGGYDTFPSGHAMIFMALSVFILHQNTGWGMICIGLTLVIGLARIAVGIHWPIDIIGGFIIGALISYGMIFVTKMI